ncbi:MAG: glycosyltransferase family 4 protein [Methanobacteriaceae archaeon]|nr:glycosyltransferase family 4 protein [Methanobacteriaceae archaeon]
MKILVLLDSDWFWKGPHQYHHLLERLSLKGHEIIITDFANYWHLTEGNLFSKKKVFNSISRFYENSNLTVIRPSFIRLPLFDYASFLLSSRSEIKKIIKEFEPDVVIGFTSILSSYWGVKYAKKNNIPFIYYWLDVNHELIPNKLFRTLGKTIERKIIENSSEIIAINEVLREYMVNLTPKSPKSCVIRGGVDFKRFNPDEINGKLIREKYGFSQDDFILFFMGWLYEFSGLEELVLDISKVKDDYPKLKLLIVGEGDQYQKLKDIITEKGLQDTVKLSGKRPYDEIPSLISSSDICLLIARNNEIMRNIVPIKIYEYLAMQKPVISTELTGVIKEFGLNNGLIYIKGPEKAFETIINLNQEDLNFAKEQARLFIKNYSWDEIITDFEALLSSIKEK